MTACTLCRRELEDDGAFTVDLSTNLILAGSKVLQATPSIAEFASVLAKHRPNLVARESMMGALYGSYIEDPPDPRILDIWVMKLRHLLKGSGFTVEGRYGNGFRILDREWDGLTVNERWLLDYLRSCHGDSGAWPNLELVRRVSPYMCKQTFYSAVGKLERMDLVRRLGAKRNSRMEAL